MSHKHCTCANCECYHHTIQTSTSFAHSQQLIPNIPNSHDHTSALRHDTGKPELHHIHPRVWTEIINESEHPLDPKLNLANEAMNEWFYHKNTEPLKTMSMLFRIQDICPVLSFGAKKYASLNYCKGMLYSRVLNSFRRHLLAILKGEELDIESNLSHSSHADCNLMFAICYELTLTTKQKEQFDNRPKLEVK